MAAFELDIAKMAQKAAAFAAGHHGAALRMIKAARFGIFSERFRSGACVRFLDGGKG